jgi:hypothetical protein
MFIYSFVNEDKIDNNMNGTDERLNTCRVSINLLSCAATTRLDIYNLLGTPKLITNRNSRFDQRM